MGRSSKEVYGADGSTNLLSFSPEKLKIVTDPKHPLYDERHALPIDEATVKNMMSLGVTQAIIVTLDTETGEVLVVDGRQRVKNAAEANRRLVASGFAPILVPAMTRKGESSDLAGVMVSTNEHRTSDGPLVKAAKMQRLRDMGYDDERLGITFGVNKQTIKNTLALLDCTKPVREAIEAGRVGVTHGLVLSKMTPSEQRDSLANLLAASDGAKGSRAKAQAKAAVLSDAPRMKTRRQIEAELERSSGAYADALQWVLGSRS